MDKKNIESIVPLLPMQMGFLWHNLKPGCDTGVLQLRCTLEGQINTNLLQNAWKQVSNKHQALRSSIHWKNVKSPVQVVMKSQSTDWHFVDLRKDENAYKVLQTFLLSDKLTPLDLNQPPGYRLALFQISDQQFEFVWSLSHVMLDGWSCALAINDWLEAYSAADGTDSPSLHLPLHDHSRWLKSQDQTTPMAFWRNYLSGVSKQNHPPHWQNEAGVTGNKQSKHNRPREFQSCKATIDSVQFTELQACLRETGVTLGVTLQATWATLLRTHSEQQQTVFGVTVSGRQIELDHVSDRVGMMINLIPVVVKFAHTGSVASWLQQLQEDFFSVIPHAHTSLQQILQSSATGYSRSSAELGTDPGTHSGTHSSTHSVLKQSSNTDANGGRLFDSLLVLENQPEVVSTDDIRISNFSSGIQSDFDLTVVIIQGDKLAVELIYNPKHFEQQNIQALSQRFVYLLRSIPSLIDSPATMLDSHYGNHKDHADKSTATFSPPKMVHNNSPRLVLSPLERQLLAIWTDTLGVSNLSLEDDFFNLGGTSLQAVQIFERIENELKVSLPATVLFNTPTVSTLATAINQNDPLSFWSTTVEIQRHGDKPPLFIPVNSAEMLMYRNLSEELGNSQPVYGFRSTDSNLSMDDLASLLVTHIVAIEPKGPYFIAGMSGAGMLSWLIAQKLEQQNRPVALLALLDAYGPEYPTLLPPVPRLWAVCMHFLTQSMRFIYSTLKRKFLHHTATSTTSGSSEQVESNMHRHLGYQQQLTQEHRDAKPFVDEISTTKPAIEKLINRLILKISSVRYRSFNLRMAFIVFIQGLLLEHRRDKGSNAITDSPSAIREMQIRYDDMYGALTPYSGKIVYFKCSERPPAVKDDPLSGWGRLVGDNMKIHPIPGSHTTLLQQPNVALLASILGREIAAISEPALQTKDVATSPYHQQAQYAGDNA